MSLCPASEGEPAGAALAPGFFHMPGNRCGASGVTDGRPAAGNRRHLGTGGGE
jgi:hypothetical protein